MRELNTTELAQVAGGFGWMKSAWKGIKEGLDWAGRALTVDAIADKLKTPYDDPTYGGGFGNCCDHLKDKDRNSDSRGSGGSNYREPKDHYSDKGR